MLTNITNFKIFPQNKSDFFFGTFFEFHVLAHEIDVYVILIRYALKNALFILHVRRRAFMHKSGRCRDMLYV